MRSSVEKLQNKKRSAVFVALICTLVGISAFSSAVSTSVARTQPMMIAVTNNSSRDMYHLYLSPRGS